LQILQQHYHYLLEQIKDLEAQLKQKLNEDEVGQRLLTIPCVGTLRASTISTELGDGKHYDSSRDFAAAKVDCRIARSMGGNFGVHKFERDCVWESRVDYGPGYRVYYSIEDGEIILLLIGGNSTDTERH